MSQPYPPQGGPQWPSQQPQYAPPPQPNPYQQPYGAPQGYQQPPPGYGPPPGAQQFQQQPPAGPPPQFATGSLDDFYSAPAVGGGGGLKFPADGSWHIGIVNRALVDSDTEQQSDINDKTKPAVDGKGNPKWVLKIPLNVAVSQDNPEGVAKLFNQGAAREDLLRAMQLVGAPPGPPEPGSAIYVCKTGTRKAGNFKANTWEYRYWRPGPEAQQIAAQYNIQYPDLSAAGQAQTLANEATAAQQPSQAPPPAAPPQAPVEYHQPVTQPGPGLSGAPPVNYQHQAPQGHTPPPAGPPPPPNQVITQAPVQVQPQATPPPVQQPPPPGDLASLPPEKQALFGQLTGAPQQ